MAIWSSIAKNGIDETSWEFITTESVSSNWQRVQQSNFGMMNLNQKVPDGFLHMYLKP